MKFLTLHRFSLLDVLAVIGLWVLMPYAPWYIELAYLVITSLTVTQLEMKYLPPRSRL